MYIYLHHQTHQEALPSTIITETLGLCPGEDDELSRSGNPRLLETEGLGVSLGWGPGGGTCRGGSPSVRHLATLVSSPVKRGGGLHVFLPEVFVSTCEVPGCVQGAPGLWPLGIRIPVEGRDQQPQTSKPARAILRAPGGSEERSNSRCDGGGVGAAYVGRSGEVLHKGSQA